MTTWFTSDTHFGHENIIRYCNRPFNDKNHMNETMIQRWNEVVGDDDTIYHLGDFAFFKTDEEYISLLEKLNGKKVLIYGNHDKQIKKNKKIQAHFVRCTFLDEISIDVDNETYSITLCHFAMRVWNKSHRGAFHLYGHSHGTLPENDTYSMDVGVDCHNFTPISFQYVLNKFTKKMMSKSVPFNQ